MVAPRNGNLDALAGALERAVASRVITADQAEQVLAAERSRGELRPAGRRLPVTEALGYLGGLLALSGAVILAIQYWPVLPVTGRLALLAAVALATWVVGSRIGDAAASALLRLRGALWFGSSAAVAGFVGQLMSDVVHADSAAVVTWSGLAVTGHAGLLWRLRDRPVQHLACLAGALAMAGGAAALVGGEGAVGLTVAGLAAGWVSAGWYQLLPPSVVALFGGGAAVLLGAAITAGDWPDTAPLLGLGAAIVLAAGGVVTERVPLTVVGLVGGFIYLPWTVGQFFADSLGVPLAMVLCGIVLLAVTLLLLRRRSPAVSTQ